MNKKMQLIIANFFNQKLTKPKVLQEDFKNKLKILITDKLKEN